MNVSIRRVEGQEKFDALYSLGQYAFRPSPPFEDREEYNARVSGRTGMTCCAALEDGLPVSVAVSSSMTQNMRGALYPVSGVWGVSSHPAARRKGYIRMVMGTLLEAERENGKIFSNLYPFRESFYERLGYVSFPLVKIARFAPQALAPLLKLDLGGEVELKMIGEAYETYREYLAGLRQIRHGMLIFDHGDAVMASRNRAWVAMARFDGRIEGIMLYTLQGEDVTHFNFSASRFYYHTHRARYLLLNWIARHIDQADRAEIWLPGDETPETWLTDLQLQFDSASRAAMSRVLDVAKIGGMTVGEGSFSAQISDPVCPWNEGLWRFDACEGKLQVSPGTQADCALTIQGLTALVAGAHDPADFALRGWGSPDPNTQVVLRRLFPRRHPYMHESF